MHQQSDRQDSPCCWPPHCRYCLTLEVLGCQGLRISLKRSLIRFRQSERRSVSSQSPKARYFCRYQDRQRKDKPQYPRTQLEEPYGRRNIPISRSSFPSVSHLMPNFHIPSKQPLIIPAKPKLNGKRPPSPARHLITSTSVRHEVELESCRAGGWTVVGWGVKGWGAGSLVIGGRRRGLRRDRAEVQQCATLAEYGGRQTLVLLFAVSSHVFFWIVRRSVQLLDDSIEAKLVSASYYKMRGASNAMYLAPKPL